MLDTVLKKDRQGGFKMRKLDLGQVLHQVVQWIFKNIPSWGCLSGKVNFP